jgi:hypothetical protein
MPFENFYRESDKTDRRRRKITGLACLLLAVYLIPASLIFRNYQTDRKKRLAESNRLKNVDLLCSTAPLPESFRLVSREKPVSDDFSSLVVYHFRSKRSLEEMMPAYLDLIDRLDMDGWKSVGDSQKIFEKHNQRFSIIQNESDSGNYEIRCYEEEISFGIN